MAMTAFEMSGFFAEQALKSAEILDTPKVRDTPYLVELNMRRAAQSHMMSAMIDWRHEIADPRPKLHLAFATCVAASERLPALDSSTPLPSRFRFYDVVFLGKLIHHEVPVTCLSLLQNCRESADVDLALDYALAGSLIGIDLLGSTIESAVFENRQDLLRKTYSTYVDLLHGNFEAIQVAEANFAARKKNSYYSGGLHIDGGGLDNSNTVDYRLAAMIETLGFETNSVHKLS